MIWSQFFIWLSLSNIFFIRFSPSPIHIFLYICNAWQHHGVYFFSFCSYLNRRKAKKIRRQPYLPQEKTTKLRWRCFSCDINKFYTESIYNWWWLSDYLTYSNLFNSMEYPWTTFYNNINIWMLQEVETYHYSNIKDFLSICLPVSCENPNMK